jgi:hypothetical protein
MLGNPEVEVDLITAMDLLVANTAQQCLDRDEFGWPFRGGTLGSNGELGLRLC